MIQNKKKIVNLLYADKRDTPANKRVGKKTAPDAIVILYGSYARGDNRKDSDMDLLVLMNHDKVTYDDEKRIKYPLFHIEYATGIMISPLVFSKKVWETKHRITPFYENVLKEGVILSW